jgi:hypothetical protein
MVLKKLVLISVVCEHGGLTAGREIQSKHESKTELHCVPSMEHAVFLPPPLEALREGLQSDFFLPFCPVIFIGL